jgi:hypothetical protein
MRLVILLFLILIPYPGKPLTKRVRWCGRVGVQGGNIIVVIFIEVAKHLQVYTE